MEAPEQKTRFAAPVILHDLNLAGAFADRVVIIHEGQFVANDIASRALTGKTLSQVFGVAMNVVCRGGASRIVLNALQL